jgi:hypothetical protein
MLQQFLSRVHRAIDQTRNDFSLSISLLQYLYYMSKLIGPLYILETHTLSVDWYTSDQFEVNVVKFVIAANITLRKLSKSVSIGRRSSKPHVLALGRPVRWKSSMLMSSGWMNEIWGSAPVTNTSKSSNVRVFPSKSIPMCPHFTYDTSHVVICRVHDLP